MAKKGHLLPKSGINSELVSIQKVKGIVKGFSYGLIDNDERVASPKENIPYTRVQLQYLIFKVKIANIRALVYI